MTKCRLPLGPTAQTEGFSYTEAMYQLCQKVLQSVNNDSNSQPVFNQIMSDCIDVENIRQQVRPSLRLKEEWKTVQDRLQYYAIRLHTSFVVSVLCRPSLRRGESIGLEPSQKQVVAEKCKQNLTETVRMYLKMNSLSIIPTRSWAFTYHGLSSAVLLGILGETKADPEVRQLQGNLISALSVTATKEQDSDPKSDQNVELSGPLSRAMTALRNIYDHGWVVETRSMALPEGQLLLQNQLQNQDETQFERQNVAIAMESMHNGMAPPLVTPKVWKWKY